MIDADLNLNIMEKNKIHKTKFYEILEAQESEENSNEKVVKSRGNKRCKTLKEYQSHIKEIESAYLNKQKKLAVNII
jgi:hypothetical protein